MGSALKKWPPKRRGEKMADRLRKEEKQMSTYMFGGYRPGKELSARLQNQVSKICIRHGGTGLMVEISPVMAGRIGLWGLIVGSRLIET